MSFDDGTFERVCINYVAHEASITCLLDVGDPDAPSKAEREVQRRGVLTLTGLLYFVIEPPHPAYPFDTAGGLDITSDDTIASWPEAPALPSVEEYNAFTHYFFVNDWNAFIYVAATGAKFTWN